MEQPHTELAHYESAHYRTLFDLAPIALALEDYSLAKIYLDELRAEGVSDFLAYADENPEFYREIAQRVVILDCNRRYIELFTDATEKDQFYDNLGAIIHPEAGRLFIKQIVAVTVDRKRCYQYENVNRTSGGERIHVLVSIEVLPGYEQDLSRVLVSLQDISQRKKAQEGLRNLLDSSPDAILIADSEGRIVYTNTQIGSLFGYTPAELQGQPLGLLVLPELQDRHRRYTKSFFDNPQTRPMGKIAGINGLHRNGQRVPVDINLGPIELDGQLLAIAVIRDLRPQRRTEQMLRIRDMAVRAARNGIIICDISQADQPIVYVNPAFEEMTGYTAQEVIGRNCRFLQGADRNQAELNRLRTALAARQAVRCVLRNYRKDGALFWNDLSLAPVRDEQGNTVHYLGVMNDITEIQHLTAKLRYRASHDPLTGLLNRWGFEKRLETLLTSAQQEQCEHALCYLDLDQFKLINDVCGHLAGDELLRQLGAYLRNLLPSRKTILARLGGDEFALLIENCDQRLASQIAEQTRSGIERFRFEWENRRFSIGVSIGVAPISALTQSLKQVLSIADSACFAAKDAGRNRIYVYRQGDGWLRRQEEAMHWVTRIDDLLEQKRFLLYRQPIMPLTGDCETRFELLLRIINDAGEIVTPGALLAAAERYDLVGKIDRWVVETAFRRLAQLLHNIADIPVYSINLSGSSISDEKFLSDIIERINEWELPGRCICFELTETAAIANFDSALRFIDKLRGLGCQFALDDFGQGLSSFAYLKRIAVDYIKIDGLFVCGMLEDPVDRIMVQSVCEIGRITGRRTVAEHVESAAVLERLKVIGVDYAQGFYLGHPEPLEGL